MKSCLVGSVFEASKQVKEEEQRTCLSVERKDLVHAWSSHLLPRVCVCVCCMCVWRVFGSMCVSGIFGAWDAHSDFSLPLFAFPSIQKFCVCFHSDPSLCASLFFPSFACSFHSLFAIWQFLAPIFARNTSTERQSLSRSSCLECHPSERRVDIFSHLSISLKNNACLSSLTSCSQNLHKDRHCSF